MNETELREAVRLTIEEMHPLMHIGDVSSFLNVSIDAIQRMILENKFPPYKKIGNRRVWPRSEINKFMEEGIYYD